MKVLQKILKELKLVFIPINIYPIIAVCLISLMAIGYGFYQYLKVESHENAQVYKVKVTEKYRSVSKPFRSYVSFHLNGKEGRIFGRFSETKVGDSIYVRYLEEYDEYRRAKSRPESYYLIVPIVIFCMGIFLGLINNYAINTGVITFEY